jgi:uncharacterized protein (TIGR03437 family)
VGTGEQNNSGDSYYGAGILKSTDGGATWTQLANPFVGPFSTSRVNGGGARIGAIAVHPSNPNVVLAAIDKIPASTAGIYRSADGGATWTQVLPGAVGTDVVFSPADGSIAYAALGSAGGSTLNGAYKSVDSGATWTPAAGAAPAALPATNVGRISLALAPSSPDTIFAGIQNSASSALLGLYKTTDGGQSWNRLITAPDYCKPQCSYNNVIRVHPADPNVVVAAGLPPYRSLDGGVTWADIAVGADGLAAHTDHHALAFTADGSRLYDGNDGGVFSTASLSSPSPVWENLNATLAITEFSTNVSIHPTDPNQAYGGTQDNGTQFYSGNLAWDQVVGGDGGATAIDPALPSIWYGALQGPQIYRLSGVTSFNTINTPFLGASPIMWNGILLTDRFSAYPPLIMDPSNPVRLYFPSQRLYETNDGAGTWNAISPDLTGNTGTISAIAVSAANPQAVAVGTNSGRFQITDNVQGASTVWVERSTGLPGRPLSQVVFDPVQPSSLYAVASGFHIAPAGTVVPGDGPGHVFKTTDYGQTWTDISVNLPNVPCNDIVVDPDIPGTLYLATDIGVFLSQDDGASWTTLSAGLPRVLVRSLNLHRPSRTLRAVTHGRGMWDLGVPVSGTSQAPHIDSFSPTTINAGAAATITVTGTNFRAESKARWSGVDRATTFVNSTTLQVSLSAADVATPGRATLIVFNPVTGGGLSNSMNVAVGPAPAFSSSGVTSVANPMPTALVPGSLSTLFGTNLAAGTVSVSVSPTLPTMLGDVTVEVGGLPAALFYVSPTQINFQVPWELEGFDRTTLIVFNGTLTSAPLQVNVVPAAPTLFSTSGTGTGQGAILIAGPEVLAAPVGAFTGSRPVRRSEFLEIYATGLGPVSRLQSDGNPKPPIFPALSRTPTVTIGGIPAVVNFSGLPPGTVGLFQINVQVPDGVASGSSVPVSIAVYGVTSNTVTVAVE